MDQSPLDALAERIARIGRRESETAQAPVQADSSYESAYLSSLVEKAIHAMDETLRRNEDKTATALESVAKWMERNDQTRTQSYHNVSETNQNQETAITKTMSLLVDRLDELDQKISKQAGPSANGMRDMLAKIETRLESLGKLENSTHNTGSVERTLKELDGRLLDISQHLDPIDDALPARQRGSRERSSSMQMMADISARQHDLDGNPTRQKLQALGARLDRNNGQENNKLQSNRQESNRQESNKHEQAQNKLTVDSHALETLRKDIAELSKKITNSSSSNETPNSPDEQFYTNLQTELKNISTSVNALAPREQIGSIESAINSLASKIDSTRDATLREANSSAQLTGVNLERQFKTLITKLDDVYPANDISILAHNIDVMKLKLDMLSNSSLDTGILQQLHDQTAQIGEHLTQTAIKPGAIEAIENCLTAIAGHLETNTTPSGRLDQHSFDDISARIGNLQSSISNLAPQKIDFSHIEQMVQKLNTKIDTISERSLDAEGIEKAIQTLGLKFNEVPAQVHIDVEGLEKSIRSLEAKLEKTPKQGGSAALDLKGFEKTIRALEVKLDQVPLQMAAHLSNTPNIEITNALSSISAKLDSAQHLSDSSQDVSRVVKALEEKIDAVKVSSNNQQNFEKEGFEKLIRSVEDRIGLIQPQAVDTFYLDKMVKDLTLQMEKAQRPSAGEDVLDALQVQISQLSEKMDKNNDHFMSLGSLESTIGDIFSQLDSVKFASRDAAETAARNAVKDAMLEFQPQGMQNTDDVKHLLNEFSFIRTTQDKTDRRTQDTLEAVHDTLEKIVERLDLLEGEVTSERKNNFASTPASKGQAHVFQDAKSHSLATTASKPVEHSEPLALKPSSFEEYVPYTAPIKDDYDYSGSDVTAQPLASKPSKSAQSAVAPETHVPAMKAIPSFSNDIDPDMPLDPGAARPNTMFQTSDAPTQFAESDTRVNSAKSSFIAAARKAAQAAAEESARALEAEKSAPSSGIFANAKQAIGGRVKSLAGYRKPLLLGLAAVVLATSGSIIYKKQALEIKTVANKTAKTLDETPNSNPVALTANNFPQREAEPQVEAPVQTQLSLPAQPASNAKPIRISDVKTGVSVAADPIQVGSIPQRNLPALARPVVNTQVMPSIQTAANSQAKAAQLVSVEDLKSRAESGDAQAQYDLGSRYIDGLSVARDPKLATQWLEKAASQGLAPAQYRLGSLYRDGKGLRNDSKLAYSWFKRSAEQGNARAMHNLAVVLAEGVNGTPDYAGAAEWFQKGAEFGIKDSQFNVAILYARGLGVSQDLVQSYKWFSIASMLGDEDAAKKRDDVGSKLTPEKLIEAKALVQDYKPKIIDARVNDIQPASRNVSGVAARQVNG